MSEVQERQAGGSVETVGESGEVEEVEEPAASGGDDTSYSDCELCYICSIGLVVCIHAKYATSSYTCPCVSSGYVVPLQV